VAVADGGLLTHSSYTTPWDTTLFFKLGAGFPRLTLWLYGDNDPYYPLSHSEANFDAFREAGGKGTFHEIGRGSGMNGHQIHVVDDVWSAIVAAYLHELGLPYTDLAAVRRQATDDEIRAAFVGKTVDWGQAAGYPFTGRTAAMNLSWQQAEVRRGEAARACTGSKKARFASNLLPVCADATRS
jgi:hypothetical protein